ncbi:MAG: hypothetical protein HY064_14375 [Bacteroidetes bacterium]|nr:hypothetical protein [Bacteroidota bacterium]
MSNTVLAMTEFLKQVELIASDYGTSLLYSFDVKGKIHFREGRNPLEKKIRPDVATIWQALPEPLQKFYSGLHDGWFQAGSEAMGPLPSASITPLSTEEWGILQNIRIDFDLKDVITLFSNGGGGYLCLNTATSPAKSLIWWSSQAPDIDVAFFDVLDEWTTMGLVD